MTTPVVTVFEAGSRRGAIKGELLRDYASVDGDELILTYRDDDGIVRKLRFRGVTQPLPYLRRCAISSSSVFTEADFLGGSTSMDDVIVPPANRPVLPLMTYVAFWQPADQLDLSLLAPRILPGVIVTNPEVPAPPGLNLIYQTAKTLTPLTVDAEEGYYRSYGPFGVPTALDHPWDIRTAGSLFPPFPRRHAVKLGPADDPEAVQVFTEADFLDPNNSTFSYTSYIDGRFRVGMSEQQIHQAFAVPISTPDILDVLTAGNRPDIIRTFGGSISFTFFFDRQPNNVVIDGVENKIWRTVIGLNPLNYSTLLHNHFVIIQSETV